MSTLPPKSALPNSNAKAHWTCRYFDLGEEIQWRRHRDRQVVKGLISKIKQNKYGRVSYFVGEEQVLLEEILGARVQ